jgi:SWI/SNF-related matrix-associated actin-dependent regulator of chromatin subfamily A3
MDNWFSEIETLAVSFCAESLLIADHCNRHVSPSTFLVHRHHGNRKITDLAKFVDFDIVLTTYATLAAEFSGNSLLHQVDWFRIVLDEGREMQIPARRYFLD